MVHGVIGLSYTSLQPLLLQDLLQQVYHSTTSLQPLREVGLPGGLHSSF